MRTWKLKLILAFALLGMTHTDLKADDLPSRTPPPQSTLDQPSRQLKWATWEDRIKPEQRESYEKKVLSIVNKAKEKPHFIELLTFYESSTATYYFLYPFLDIKDWDKIYAFWAEESKKADTKKDLNSYSVYLSTSSRNFSNPPLNGQLSTQSPNYIHVEHYHIVPAAEEKFEQLLAEWGRQAKAKAPDCGWLVQKTIIGHELPAYLVIWGDCLKAIEDVAALDKFLLEKQAFGSVIKRVTSEDKLYVPKLSTAPLKFFE